jgi:hypothetical protein
MQFTGDDFLDKNVCSIVVELPNSALGNNQVGIWARAADKTADGWVQADRGGRPLQAVFLPGEKKDEYLRGEPANDEPSHTNWNTRAAARRRRQRPSRESCCRTFSTMIRARRCAIRTTGRTLTDDVVDLCFSTYAKRNVTDKVGPHGDLLDEFPYLGPAHDSQSQWMNSCTRKIKQH